MCNVNCIRWVAKNITKEDINKKKVLEVGSNDVNGSPRCILELLEPAKYTGVDLVKGPGVDVICPADKMVEKFGKESFDMVISTCTLEHIMDWRKAVSNIKNVCKSNGVILFIVPSDWRYHGYPYDFWRYEKEDIKDIFCDCEILKLEEDPQKPSLVYAKIRKPSGFVEKDLSDFKLYSIITNKRIKELDQKDLRNFLRRLTLKDKIKGLRNKVKGIGRSVKGAVAKIGEYISSK